MSMPKRTQRAIERDPEVIRLNDGLFLVKSSGRRSPKDYYEVDTDELTCECPDNNARGEVCYHLRAAALKDARNEVQEL